MSGYLQSIRGRQSDQRWRRWLLSVAIVGLAAGAVLAVRSWPEDLDEFEWWPLAMIAVLSVPGVTLNSCEYLLTARLSGVTVRFASAVRVAIYGTAANLLPLPGASFVRIGAMRQSGASLGRATTATAAAGIAWLAMSLLAAGAVLIPRGLIALPPLMAGAIALLLFAGVVARSRAHDEALQSAATLGLAELGFVVVAASRLWLALLAIGAEPSLAAAFTIGASGAVASALGFLPGGLGVREGLAAALGPLVGIEPAVAFLAVLIDRIVGLSTLALIATALLASERWLSTGRERPVIADSSMPKDVSPSETARGVGRWS